MGKLYFISGNIIDYFNNMDVVVNAQNKYMINGSGICGAIYSASGMELLNYCKETYKTEMQPCEVRITPGFNLPMDIIHVLAPKYYEETDSINSLMDCYNNLLLNIKNDLESIDEIKKYLEDNNLLENDIVSKYNNFVKGLELQELCLTQKLLCLQYTIYNFNLARKQLDVLIYNM